MAVNQKMNGGKRMRLRNNPVEDFGGFELDTSAVELHSANRENILLPYHGPLPEQMS